MRYPEPSEAGRRFGEPLAAYAGDDALVLALRQHGFANPRWT